MLASAATADFLKRRFDAAGWCWTANSICYRAALIYLKIRSWRSSICGKNLTATNLTQAVRAEGIPYLSRLLCLWPQTESMWDGIGQR